MSTYPPPVALPPTANTLSSQQRAALVRSTRKLCKVLGDVPRVPGGAPSTSRAELSRTTTATSTVADTESTWSKRKPTHLPPLLKLSAGPNDVPDSPVSPATPVYHRPPTHRGSVLSIAPSIISNAPSTASGSSTSENASSDASQRRAKLERLRRKLGDDVPATAVFPSTPRTAVPAPSTSRPTPRARTRSFARLPSQADDARSVAFSINSDESVHTVTFTAARVRSSPRPHKTKHVYQTGPLPPIPPLPAHLVAAKKSSSSSRRKDDDDAGLLRPRQKMAAGSKIGGSDFKAARRAKREGRANGTAEPGELVEMVGFM